MTPPPAVPKRRRVAPLIAVLIVAVLGLAIGTSLYRQEGGAVLGPLGSQPGGIAIAVLPFDNQSGDGQEFFSNGVTDGLIAALAKVQDLRVVGRESVFQTEKDDDAVVHALGAAYRVEGTVRKAGDQLRITARLTGPDGRGSLWRETYDRPIADIFAVEAEMAQAVAAALQVPLGLRPGDSLVPERTKDAAAYEDYLRAKALARTAGSKPLADATVLLERVAGREPDYAPASALLALVYEETPLYAPSLVTGAADEFRYIVATSLPKAEAAARRAIQLDPKLAEGYAALGLVERDRGKFAASEDAFKQALALDPRNPIALHGYGEMLAAVARLKDALVLRQQLMVLEPFVPAFNTGNALQLWLDAQDTAATAILRALPPSIGTPLLAETWAAAGRYNSSADTLAAMPPGIYPPEVIQEAVRLLRTAPSFTASPLRLARLNGLSWIYLHVGATGRALEFHELMLAAGDIGGNTAILWHPAYAPLRKTERFKAYARKAGLVDYWRERGWPEFCHPATAEDFACE